MSNSVHDRSPRGYWPRSLWLIGVCLLAWLAVTLFPFVLAQLQVAGSLLGWPLIFALAAFGVPLLYLAIIGVYCLVMDRLDATVAPASDEQRPS